ncbi:MAG: CotH kinase family protein [Spirochaetales bacterium]|nr:CotH kinase family protein [Spirochaetales bacterium]
MKSGISANFRIMPALALSLAFVCCVSQSVSGQAAATSVQRELTGTEKKALKEKISANRFCPEGYDELFRHGNLHDFEIVISRKEWKGLLRDMKTYARKDPDGKGLTGNYRQAELIYRGPAGNTVISQVGFRTKGNYTRPLPQDAAGNFHRAHFKIKFNKRFEQKPGTEEYLLRKERRFCTLREIDLRANLQSTGWDSCQIRELYAYDLLNRAGVYTSRTGSAKLTVTIGGKKHYFGIYTLVEPIDKSFLTRRFGKDGNDGNLYKCLWGDSGPATLEPLDQKFTANRLFREEEVIGIKDWTKHYRPTYDLKTNEDKADHSRLLDFIGNLDVLRGKELKKYLDAHFDVDRFLRYQAMNVLLGKWDDYWAMGNNYYLYFDPAGRIGFFPNDYDMCLGGGFMLFDPAEIGIYEWGNRCRQFLRLVAPSIPEKLLDWYGTYTSPLTERIFSVDEYRALYEGYLKEFISPQSGLFLYSGFKKIFDRMYALYREDLANDMNEGAVMTNDDATTLYFSRKTKSIIRQLGLNESEYEVF